MSADRLLPLALAALLYSATSAAATVTIVNTDSPGIGFNDVTPTTPVDGNPGITLGEQRLYAFQKAADTWGRLLDSSVEIRINGAMKPLDGCGTNSVVLGQTATNGAASNFANAPRADRAYPGALANALAGSDLDPSTNDMDVSFNVTIDSGTCLAGTVGWWYGVNDPSLVPSDSIPLLPVVFHEIGHGLGFTSQMVTFFGIHLYLTDEPPVWLDYIYDLTEQKPWSDPALNNNWDASWINDPNVVWSGSQVNRYQKQFLGPPLVLHVNAPAAIVGDYTPIQPAGFGPPITSSSGLSGDVVLVDDGIAGAATGDPPVAGSVNDGCETPFANAAAVAGKIALIDRGYCNFTVKVKNAQLNGAVGVLIGNNAATGLPGMGGADGTITIPSLGITQAHATLFKSNLEGLNAQTGLGTGLSGVNGGCVRLFAPNPDQPGSSISHFHSDANPNLLMEPALNRSIFDKVDLTIELFRDIGWTTGRDEVLMADGFDPNPCAVGTAP